MLAGDSDTHDMGNSLTRIPFKVESVPIFYNMADAYHRIYHGWMGSNIHAPYLKQRGTIPLNTVRQIFATC